MGFDFTHDMIARRGTHRGTHDGDGTDRHKHLYNTNASQEIVENSSETHGGEGLSGKIDNSFAKQLKRTNNITAKDWSEYSSAPDTYFSPIRHHFILNNQIQSTNETNSNYMNKQFHQINQFVHMIDIVEEDSDIPKLLIKVGSNESNANVTYFLNTTSYDHLDLNRKFKLNATSGELYLMTPLDRDAPFGRSKWRFSILAKHSHSTQPFGYADVVINVLDINDNTPFFQHNPYHASIYENSPKDKQLNCNY
ncbi:unnamed protein product, partial [Medioppia subpectinata]